MTEEQSRSGGCLCGAVAFTLTGPLRHAHGCHCYTCRRLSGHFVAATQARWADLVFHEDRGLQWFTTSDIARRGFCRTCGAQLFYDASGGAEDGHVSIHMGALDDPSGLEIERHIYVDEKTSYYAIGDTAPLYAGHDQPITDEGQ